MKTVETFKEFWINVCRKREQNEVYRALEALLKELKKMERKLNSNKKIKNTQKSLNFYN